MPGKLLVMLGCFIAFLISPSLSVFSEALISVVINPSLAILWIFKPCRSLPRLTGGQSLDVPLEYSCRRGTGHRPAWGHRQLQGGKRVIHLSFLDIKSVSHWSWLVCTFLGVLAEHSFPGAVLAPSCHIRKTVTKREWRDQQSEEGAILHWSRSYSAPRSARGCFRRAQYWNGLKLMYFLHLSPENHGY